MLSALIPSIHSYPAIQLVPKPVNQRYVQPSPLVDYSRITTCSDYIFALPLVRIRASAYYGGSKTHHPSGYKTGTSRYGVKPNNVLNSSLDLFVRVA